MTGISISILILSALFFTSCDKEEKWFSENQIKQALSDIKGHYFGTVKVSYYHGTDISEFLNAMAISRDSLKFDLSLLPIAEMISDRNTAEHLCRIGEIQIAAGYDFLQMDGNGINFILHPADATIYGGYGAPATIKIVFAQNLGGNAEPGNFILFNISPKELWINDNKYAEFPQLVYHFRGEYD